MRFVISTELDAAYNCYYIFFWQTVKVEILKKRPLQSFYSPAEASIFYILYCQLLTPSARRRTPRLTLHRSCQRTSERVHRQMPHPLERM